MLSSLQLRGLCYTESFLRSGFWPAKDGPFPVQRNITQVQFSKGRKNCSLLKNVLLVCADVENEQTKHGFSAREVVWVAFRGDMSLNYEFELRN